MRLKYKTFEYGLTTLLRWGLGCLFIWSSLPKIRQPFDFLANVYAYELAGPKLGMLVAMVLPWLELILGICLVGGVFVGGALLVGTGLMAIFAFGHASVLYRGLYISCGCFSTTKAEIIGYYTLARTSLILAVFLWVLCWHMFIRPLAGTSINP